jgi:hypothetical protein
MPVAARRTGVLALLAALALVLAGPWTPQGVGQVAGRPGVPRADCGPGSNPETAEQGRVPAADHDSGRADRPYTCNTELVGHHGATGGFKVHRYVDAQGRECAYYDSTLVFPLDLPTQLSEGAGVVVLDMADPSDPVLTAQLTTPAMLSPHESLELNQARGLLAAVAGTTATSVGVIDLYDVSQDCTAPTLLSSTPTGVLGHESGFSPDGLTFFTASTFASTVVAVDVSDPTAPVPVWFGPVNSHGIQISDDGSRAYLTPIDVGSGPVPSTGELDGGIAIYDISAVTAREPAPSATLISELTWAGGSIPQTAIPVTIDGRPYLVEVDEFVSFRDFGDPLAGTPGVARIIDIADETAPRVVADIRLEVHDPAIRPGLAGDPGADRPYQGYAGHYCAVPQREEPGIVACSMIGSGLRVIDIRDPLAPREIAYFNAPADPSALVLNPDGAAFAMSAPAFVPERGEIWYSDTASGFWAVRVADGVWPFAPEVVRLGGPTRIDTAVEVSRDAFPDGTARTVVLARADDFPDAVAGGPLAVALDGPILLSGRDVVPDATRAEIDRVLADDGEVVLLGGTAALSGSVAAEVAAAGHPVRRVGGADRFETAVAIADALPEPPTALVLADGTTFADAVVAGPLAAVRGGAVLLTGGAALPDPTAAALARAGEVPVAAVGPAAVAASTGLPGVERLDGSRSGDVGVDVARAGFDAPARVGLARRDLFPDALTAGAVLGRPDGGPLLLVDTGRLPDAVAAHLGAIAPTLRTALLLGGETAVGQAVAEAIAAILRAD